MIILRHSDIKVGCIYYVDFEPTQKSEFDGKHLSLALRKNDDNHTVIVLPLTSSPKGLGKGKIELGVLKCLPLSLQNKISYAAVNQVRTVNSTRFFEIKDNGKAVAPKVDNNILEESLYAILNDITYNTDRETKNNLFKKIYIDSSVERLNILLFDLLKEINSKNKNKADISKLKSDILEIMIYVPYKIIYNQIDKRVKPLARKIFLKNFIKIILTSPL